MLTDLEKEIDFHLHYLRTITEFEKFYKLIKAGKKEEEIDFIETLIERIHHAEDIILAQEVVYSEDYFKGFSFLIKVNERDLRGQMLCIKDRLYPYLSPKSQPNEMRFWYKRRVRIKILSFIESSKKMDKRPDIYSYADKKAFIFGEKMATFYLDLSPVFHLIKDHPYLLFQCTGKGKFHFEAFSEKKFKTNSFAFHNIANKFEEKLSDYYYKSLDSSTFRCIFDTFWRLSLDCYGYKIVPPLEWIVEETDNFYFKYSDGTKTLQPTSKFISEMQLMLEEDEDYSESDDSNFNFNFYEDEDEERKYEKRDNKILVKFMKHQLKKGKHISKDNFQIANLIDSLADLEADFIEESEENSDQKEVLDFFNSVLFNDYRGDFYTPMIPIFILNSLDFSSKELSQIVLKKVLGQPKKIDFQDVKILLDIVLNVDDLIHNYNEKFNLIPIEKSIIKKIIKAFDLCQKKRVGNDINQNDKVFVKLIEKFLASVFADYKEVNILKQIKKAITEFVKII